MYVWTDASAAIECSPTEEAELRQRGSTFQSDFRGWGMMAYLPASGTVYLSQDLIPFMVRKVLADSTTSELLYSYIPIS